MVAVVSLAGGAFTITSVKDDSNNAFVQLGVWTQGTGSNETILAVYALNTPAASVGTQPYITATCSSASNGGFNMVIQEIAGLATFATAAGIVDGTPGHLGGGTSGTSGSIGPPSYASSAAGEYLLYVYGDEGSSSTVTAASGYTLDPNSINTSGNTDVIVTYKSSTGGTETGSMSTSNGYNWNLGMLALKLASTGINVTPSTAAVKVAATAPTPSAGTDVTPTAAAVHVVATAPQVTIPGSVSAVAAIVKVTAYAPIAGAAQPVSVALTAATIIVAASPPTPYVPMPSLLGLPQVNDWPVNYTPDYADLNLYIRDAFNFLTSPPLFRGQQNATHSVGGATVVEYQDVLEDNYSGWSSVTNSYVAQVPGWYGITAMCCCGGSLIGNGFSLGPAYILNGVQYGPIWLDLSDAGTDTWRWAFYEETFLNVGDSVQIVIGTGATGVTTNTSYPSYFEIAWLSK
jgi:hypothetical protein